MEQFLEIHKINNLSKTTSIKLIINDLPKKKALSSNSFTVDFYQAFKRK